MPLSASDHGLVSLPRGSLAALRGVLLRDGGPTAAASLQEAGYVGAGAVYTTFVDWLGARGVSQPDSLDVTEFERLASEFFAEMGWGSLTLNSLEDAVAALDTEDWWEDDAASDGG